MESAGVQKWFKLQKLTTESVTLMHKKKYAVVDVYIGTPGLGRFLNELVLKPPRFPRGLELQNHPDTRLILAWLYIHLL
jgi:hypothetical protein